MNLWMFTPYGLLLLTIILGIYVHIRRPVWFINYCKLFGANPYEDPFYPFQRWDHDPATVPWQKKRLGFLLVMIMFFAVAAFLAILDAGQASGASIFVLCLFGLYFFWLTVRITLFGGKGVRSTRS